MVRLRIGVALIAAAGLALAAIGCAGSNNPVSPSPAVAADQQLALTGSPAMREVAAGEQGDCPNDSKLLGLFEVSADYRPGTWWFLSKNSLILAGFPTDEDQEAKLEQIFGVEFNSLAEAVDFLIEGVRSWDKNGNEWVCAYELRGTRAYTGEPLINTIFFGISDDKLRKNSPSNDSDPR